MTDNDTLHFYFDVISHNAYVAWTQIHDLAARHGLAVAPVPVLFAGLDLAPWFEVRPSAWRRQASPRDA